MVSMYLEASAGTEFPMPQSNHLTFMGIFIFDVQIIKIIKCHSHDAN